MIVSYENLIPRDKIIKGKTFLNKSNPFFARIVLNMESEECVDKEAMPTMGVSQYGKLYWNPDFVNGLTLDELMGVLAHEAMHVATLSFQRKRFRDMQLWNIATDIAINQILVSTGMSLPKEALVPDQSGIMHLPMANLTINVKNISAEKIYEFLEKEADKVKENYAPMDTHIEGDNDDEGNSTGEGKGSGASEANKQKWKQVFASAATYAKMRGKASGGLERLLGEILNPKLNWKDLLNQYITKELPFNYSMSRPNRRYNATGIYQPVTIKENLELVITVDVSGSIADEELLEFITEVCGVCTAFDQVKARILFWSTEVDKKGDTVIDRETATDLVRYKPYTTGGTTFSCVADYIEDEGINSQLFITLTDGYIESNPRVPNGTNLFVISKHGTEKICKDYGQCCSLNDV